MREFDFLKAAMVFGSMTAVDMFFALYTRRTSHGQAFSAGIFAMMILLFSGYVVVSYVGDFRYLIPAMLGSFVGTYITVRLDSKKITP